MIGLKSVSIEYFLQPEMSLNSSLKSISIEVQILNLPEHTLKSVSAEAENEPVAYIIRLQDNYGNVIAGANINYDGADYITNIDGWTPVILIDTTTPKAMTFTASGFQDYVHLIDTQISRTWYHTMNRIVPVILTHRGSSLNPKANDPNNKTIT